MSRFILRLDDLSPGMDWERLSVLTRVLRQTGVKPVVGVIPACADANLQFESNVPDFWDRIRRMRASGWSIAQHGFTHVCDTDEAGLLGIGRHSEFAGHSRQTQAARIVEGKNILTQEGCWEPIVLADEQFVAVSDGYGFAPYKQDGLVFVPQMFSRPYHAGFGTYTICVHTNSLDSRLFGRITEFVTRHQRQFITFDEADACAQVPLPHDRLAQRLSGSFMRTARRLRYPGSRKPISVDVSLQS